MRSEAKRSGDKRREETRRKKEGKTGFGKVLDSTPQVPKPCQTWRKTMLGRLSAPFILYKGQVPSLDPPVFMCVENTGSPILTLDPPWTSLGSPMDPPFTEAHSLGGSAPQTPRSQSASGLRMEAYSMVSNKCVFFQNIAALAPQGHARGILVANKMLCARYRGRRQYASPAGAR